MLQEEVKFRDGSKLGAIGFDERYAGRWRSGKLRGSMTAGSSDA